MTNLPSADIGLGQTLLRRATISPDKPALTFEGKTQSFADLGDRVRRLAAVLRAGGVSTGDRVGYIGLNHPVFLEMLYACGCLGAIFVPLSLPYYGALMHQIVYVTVAINGHSLSWGLICSQLLRAIKLLAMDFAESVPSFSLTVPNED